MNPISCLVKTMPSQTKLDESQLSVVALPPTPAKPDTKETKESAKESTKDSAKVSPAPSSSSDDDQAVSSQILPLHRLSGSSLPRPHTQAGQAGGQAGGQGGSSLPYSQTSHSALAQQVLTRNKPVAEVSPFSNIKVTDSNNINNFTHT